MNNTNNSIITNFIIDALTISKLFHYELKGGNSLQRRCFLKKDTF